LLLRTRAGRVARCCSGRNTVAVNPGSEKVDEGAEGVIVAGDAAPAGCLQDLEEELAYQGQTVAALNEALGQQQRDILTLRRQVELLAQEVRLLRQTHNSAAGGGNENDLDSPDERPPHY
jgi:uncharacterized coiled-coil protein SlyX